MLRLMCALPGPEVGPVRVLDVDDFALKNGHRCGTVLFEKGNRRPLVSYPGCFRLWQSLGDVGRRQNVRLQPQWVPPPPGKPEITAPEHSEGLRAQRIRA